jgi:hypothetical protein
MNETTRFAETVTEANPMKDARKRTFKGTGIVGLLAVAVFLAAGPAPSGAASKCPHRDGLIRYYPEDVLFAGAAKIRDMRTTLAGMEGLIRALGGDEAFRKYTEGLKNFDSEFGVDLKAELDNITGEAGFFLDLENLDALIAASGRNKREAPRVFLKNVCLLVGLKDPERFDAFVEKLAARAQWKPETISGPSFSYIRIPMEGKNWSLPLVYTHHKGAALIAFSEETLTSALETGRSGRNLGTSPDYIKTFRLLSSNPDSWGYLNLPKLARLLDNSAVIKGVVALKPEAQRVYTYVMGLQKEMSGVGWTVVRTEGGILKQAFGPDLVSSPLAAVASAGIVSAVSASRLELSIEGRKQETTMSDIRTIGTAVQSFDVDAGKYPGPTEGFVPVERIRAELEPEYVKILPLKDAWGHDILYRSDGKSFAILSPGSDGKLDMPYGPQIEKAETRKPEDDLVYSDGRFVRAPAASAP